MKPIDNILQDIYDSEINFSISCFWDGGFEVKLGDVGNGYKAECGGIYGMENVVKWLKEEIIEHIPDSDFAEKYKRKRMIGIE